MAYVPQFTISPNLLEQVEQIAALRERIQNAVVDLAWIPALQKDTRTRNVHASTAIEGNPLTLEQVRALEEGRELSSSSARSKREVINYFAGLRYVEKNAAKKKIGHTEILELHRILAGEVMDQGEAGKYRMIAVRVGPYLPPPPDAVSGLMFELLEWWNIAARTLSPVLSSAILHYRFEAIHPFCGRQRPDRAREVKAKEQSLQRLDAELSFKEHLQDKAFGIIAEVENASIPQLQDLLEFFLRHLKMGYAGIFCPDCNGGEGLALQVPVPAVLPDKFLEWLRQKLSPEAGGNPAPFRFGTDENPVFSNPDGGLPAPLYPGDRLGRALAAPGDLDGDGCPDLVAGLPGADLGGADRGALRVLLLADDATVASEIVVGWLAGGFGDCLAYHH